MAPILDSLCHVQAFCSFCSLFGSLFSLHSSVVLVENHGPRHYNDSAVLVVVRKLSNLCIGRMLHIVAAVGFEPTPLERLEQNQEYHYFFLFFIYFFIYIFYFLS